MYYRPAFVTNSSSTGYYFFVPEDKEFTPEFFDRIGITPLHVDGDYVVKGSDLYTDVKELEEEPIERDIDLIELIQSYSDLIPEDTGNSTNKDALFKQLVEAGMDSRTLKTIQASDNYYLNYVTALSKILELKRKGYKIVHVDYPSDAGPRSLAMDSWAIHGEIVEIDGVGGYVALSYH